MTNLGIQYIHLAEFTFVGSLLTLLAMSSWLEAIVIGREAILLSKQKVGWYESVYMYEIESLTL